MHADGSKEYYFKDHIGSARVVLARSAAGVVTVKAKYEYKPFGGLVSSSSGKSDRHGYAGDEFDFESDLVDMGARMYMPEIGRFLSVDPLAEAFPTQSPYNFARNNPINFRDPSGLAPEKEKGDRVLGTAYGTISQSLANMNIAAMQSFFGSLDNSIADVFSDANQFYQSRYNDNMSCVDAWGYENLLLRRMRSFSFFRLGCSFGSGGGGSNGVTTPTYMGSMAIDKPKDFTTKGWNAVLKGAYKQLETLSGAIGGKREVGFFIKYDKSADSYTAEFYVGKEEGSWIGFDTFNASALKMEKGDMLMGFVHSHPGKYKNLETGKDFCLDESYQDIQAMCEMSLGKYSWAQIPAPGDVDGKHYRTNNNSAITPKLFFGVISQMFFHGFSWNSNPDAYRFMFGVIVNDYKANVSFDWIRKQGCGD